MEKILVVDDSILNQTMLRTILKPHYEVYTAFDSVEALRVCAHAQPSLILLDLILPGLNGFEVLNILKSNPQTRDIPVIIITGLDGPDHEERALLRGAVDFIAKPFRPRIVLARVNTHVELYRFRKNAERQATYDGLTDIPNRRGFDRQFHALWEASRQGGMPFSAALSDIDFFKGYNDRYGHPAGDCVIRAVALTLRQTILPFGGYAARYGGEEFALLLPGFSADSASQIVQTACNNVESLAIPYVSGAASSVTVSIGGVTVGEGYHGTPESALEAADKLLYEAKNSGRNRVVWDYLDI